MSDLLSIMCPICATPVPIHGLDITSNDDPRIRLVRQAIAKNCPYAEMRSHHSEVIVVTVADPDLIPLKGGPFQGFYRKRLGASFHQVVGELEHVYRLSSDGSELIYDSAKAA